MSQSPLKYVRVFGLLLLLVPVLLFAGASACGIVAEYGIYRYDDDLVSGGRAISAMHQGDAARRLGNVRHEVLDYEYSQFNTMWIAPGKSAELPLHGWMVYALPYSWTQGGVSQFIHYSKPWDDPANRNAFTRRFKDYESPFRSLPRHNDEGYALAHIAGNQRVFGPGGAVPNQKIEDGSSQTILAGDAAGNYQPWGKPRTDRDPALGINRSKDGFGGPWANGGAMMVFADGSVRMMSKDTSPDVLRALANPADGEP